MLRRIVKWGLGRVGFELKQVSGKPEKRREDRIAFRENCKAIVARRNQQTLETVAALRHKYETPIFGKVQMWDLIERLALIIDPVDTGLFCTSQYVHALQVAEGMIDDGVTDEDMLIAALIHDVGKVMMLVGETPENTVWSIRPVGHPEPGAGLDQCVFQWGHDELAFSRIQHHVPDAVSRLVRYHGIHLDEVAPLFNDADRTFVDRYLRHFQPYDHGTKSMLRPPSLPIARHRDLVEKYFPHPILF